MAKAQFYAKRACNAIIMYSNQVIMLNTLQPILQAALKPLKIRRKLPKSSKLSFLRLEQLRDLILNSKLNLIKSCFKFNLKHSNWRKFKNLNFSQTSLCPTLSQQRPLRIMSLRQLPVRTNQPSINLTAGKNKFSAIIFSQTVKRKSSNVTMMGAMQYLKSLAT